MKTNDKSPTPNYDSDKDKSEIDSDIRVLNIRQRLAAHSGRTNHRRTGIFLPGGGGGGGEPFAQKILTSCPNFMKQSKGNEGHTMH